MSHGYSAVAAAPPAAPFYAYSATHSSSNASNGFNFPHSPAPQAPQTQPAPPAPLLGPQYQFLPHYPQKPTPQESGPFRAMFPTSLDGPSPAQGPTPAAGSGPGPAMLPALGFAPPYSHYAPNPKFFSPDLSTVNNMINGIQQPRMDPRATSPRTPAGPGGPVGPAGRPDQPTDGGAFETDAKLINNLNSYSLLGPAPPLRPTPHFDTLGHLPNAAKQANGAHNAPPASATHSGRPGGRSAARPRRKKQCPECHLFFSNLATHKSTHLLPSSRPHTCQVCHRGFARPNDLFRHMKSHWKDTGEVEGAYKCPFFPDGEAGDSGRAGSPTVCHSTGFFSRCDTYKNHLKALHFNYPLGTRKKDRPYVSGTCKGCNMWFENVDTWIGMHVEPGKCPGMPGRSV